MAKPQALLGSNTTTVKSHNLRVILLTLLRDQPISRVRLARRTGLSSTTVTNLITELLDQGIVIEEGTEISTSRRGAGRPRMALRLVPEARYALGVHIGVGNVRVALTDLLGRPIGYLVRDHEVDRSPEAVVDDIVELLQLAVGNTRIDPRLLVGIGVGASGLVDPARGVNLLAPNLNWRDVPLQALLNEHTDLPICVDNNVRAMALGEALFGVGRGTRALAFVYARIGVGAGLVVDGEIYRGSSAGAGEIGHTTLIADGGAPCRCGNTGCLETLISEPVLLGLAEELAQREPQGILAAHLRQKNGSEAPRLLRVFEAARAGDVATRAMLEERACYMGIALANLVNILNPELIVLGGIFEQGKDLLLPATEAVMRQRAFANLGEQVRLCTTRFGRQAGVIGAASLALEAFFYREGDIASPTGAYHGVIA